jgi:hypothetical protein
VPYVRGTRTGLVRTQGCLPRVPVYLNSVLWRTSLRADFSCPAAMLVSSSSSLSSGSAQPPPTSGVPPQTEAVQEGERRWVHAAGQALLPSAWQRAGEGRADQVLQEAGA